METAFEHKLTSSYKADLIAHMDRNPGDFAEAMTLAVSNKQPYAHRAAWLLWSCIGENDPRVKPYLQQIIGALPTKTDDHQRELFMILQKMELDEADEGTLLNICVHVWEKINKKPSVRFNAFKLMVKIAKKYPELSAELGFLTQIQYMATLSSSATKSILKMMVGLKH